MQKLITLSEQIAALPVGQLRVQAETENNNAITLGARSGWPLAAQRRFDLSHALEDLTVQAGRVYAAVHQGKKHWARPKRRKASKKAS